MVIISAAVYSDVAMRLVVMSDIHGNLSALQTVADSLPPRDQVVVAGDLCLEGPRPAEVIDLVRELGWSLVMGNTDRDILEPDKLKGKKREMADWARREMGEARLDFLAQLPFSLRIETPDDAVLVVHANPLNMDQPLLPTMSEQDLLPYIKDVDATVLAFGHLHIPYVRPVDGVLLVDVSSVGHPKDRDLRAAYTVMTWDGGRRQVEGVRVPYDIERTVEEMRRSGMPEAEKQIASLLRASY